MFAAKSLQSCPTLCDPIDGRPPGSPIPGILQARTLEWFAISFSNVSGYLIYSLVKPCMCACMPSHFSHVQLCVTLWTVALQALLSMGFSGQRILEWIAMPSSRASSQPRDRTHFSLCFLHWKTGFLPLAPHEKVVIIVISFILDTSGEGED